MTRQEEWYHIWPDRPTGTLRVNFQSFVIFQQKFVDFRSRALECWFYNFFFLCGQSLADHLFFDHLRSIFYHFSLNQYLTLFFIDGAIHPYEVNCSKPAFLRCSSSALRVLICLVIRFRSPDPVCLLAVDQFHVKHVRRRVGQFFGDKKKVNNKAHNIINFSVFLNKSYIDGSCAVVV